MSYTGWTHDQQGRWRELAHHHAEYAALSEADVAARDWIEEQRYAGSAVGVILPEGFQPVGAPLVPVVFPLGCAPGQWFTCSGLLGGETARAICPQCGIVWSIYAKDFTIARHGQLWPRLQCTRCPWQGLIRLQGWKAPLQKSGT